MLANKSEQVEKLNEDDFAHPIANGNDSVHSTFQRAINFLPHKLMELFEECWAVFEEGDGSYEEELRRRIEGVTDEYLETPVCDYLRDLTRQVRKKPFFISIKGLAAKLLGEVSKRWLWHDKSTDENALKLKQCVLSLMQPYMECVPLRMRVRVRVELWRGPTAIPEHGTAPAVAFAIDAETGQIHRRFYGTNRHPVPVAPIIPCGLTILCQPFRYGDEAYAQDNNQGGHMYSEEGTMTCAERASKERTAPVEPPKPGPR